MRLNPSAPVKREMIFAGDFLPATYRGLERFVEDTMGWAVLEEGYLRGPVERWAMLYFRLKKAEDRPEWFPSGKWATVQRVERLLEEAA